ncbi:WXG100 family type VII secretion target [Kitasatospora paranensis]|uniref:WXG100 family type VII secretion target n=1 Tax=Kitasatospora paranensis TaxID=258053 RepID=A0ABW2FUV2_9ACTN
MSNDEPVRYATEAVPAEPLRRMSATLPTQQAQPRTGTYAAERAAGASGDGGGGAGQGFQVDPEQYRSAVSPVLAASEQVRSLYTSLSAFLTSLEAQKPWGDDESGKKFAEGDKGYLKYSKDTLDVIKGLPEALKGIADGLKAMADGYEGADGTIATEFDGMDTGANPMPAAPSLPSAPVNNPVHIPVTPRIAPSGRH